MKKICILGVPSSAGARRTGQERAPQLFRRAGLLEKLQSVGLEATDLGDLPEAVYQPDHKNLKAQNRRLVAEVSGRVAVCVRDIVKDNNVPLVIGGDCTITLGAAAGMISHIPGSGLMYFDGDVDLNTPDTTPSGIFDGMVIAHMTGRGDDILSHSGPRYPLMPEEMIFLFGYNSEAGSIDAAELEILNHCGMMKYPVSQIRGKAGEAALEAVSRLEKKADNILVHFDVDVIDFYDFPAGDVPHNNGLGFEDAMDALAIFTHSPKFGGLVITEFNADRDPDEVLANRLVDAVVNSLKKKND